MKIELRLKIRSRGEGLHLKPNSYADMTNTNSRLPKIKFTISVLCIEHQGGGKQKKEKGGGGGGEQTLTRREGRRERSMLKYILYLRKVENSTTKSLAVIQPLHTISLPFVAGSSRSLLRLLVICISCIVCIIHVRVLRSCCISIGVISLSISIICTIPLSLTWLSLFSRRTSTPRESNIL